MFNILTLNKISPTGTNLLTGGKYNITSECKNPDGIMLRSFDMHEMELNDGLLCVARAGAGVNNIPVDKCSDKGIVVFNTPGANANAVKELVVAGILLASRKISEGIIWTQGLAGQSGVDKLVEKGKAEFIGPEITGKKLGVIGLGAIGVLVANVCVELGMKVVGFDPFLSVDSAWNLSRKVEKASGLDAIFANCDYISLHVPLTSDTKFMFNDEVFAKCKNGLRLLNFSRGDMVDNAAVKRALDSGRVACYVTDFPNDDIVGVKNIVTIPHLGASTPESEDNCAEMAAAQAKDYLEYGNIKNSVNYPNCELEYTGRTRICVLHKNIPNVVGPITSFLAGHGINIGNMISKSKSGYSYAMIDIDQKDVKDIKDIEAELNNIDGVIKVRVI